ncbi:MAG: hypothetical protein KKH77_05255 [Candidatus Omnitrophica bacterium]|nr:hypothetical protein [Candidatus Omnitrophota bacterium]
MSLKMWYKDKIHRHCEGRRPEAILKILFIVWVVLWIGFLARELFVKNNIRDYKNLLTRTLEGKRSYVTGDRLYDFLTYCKTTMPENSAYNIIGMDEGALESRKAVYYLYPNVKTADPDFIIDISQYTIKRVEE